MNDRMTLQDWTRIREFLFDLTDPEVYGFAVSSEVRRRALELQSLFNAKDSPCGSASQS